MTVCDSCLDAARDESEGYDLSPSRIARTMGNEISDHLCEARDSGRKCDCLCNPKTVSPGTSPFGRPKN
jgi:hypothetical protein